MRLALICLQPDADTSAGQALAVALETRDRGRLAPLLVALKGSPLAREAGVLGLPLATVARPGSLFGALALWRRLRSHERVIIQCVGPDGMRLGRALHRMRGKGSSVLAQAFFIRPPAFDRRTARILAASRIVFYGSGHVRQRLADDFGLPEERMCPCPPGIAVQTFSQAPPFAGGQFVFAMAESLLPKSGALTVARAMAALWQRDDLPPWEVRMYGEGPRFQEILSESKALGVAGRLSLLAEQDMPAALALAHAWLAPGSSATELPETLWAGFAAGMPVVASLSSLHRERLAGLGPAGSAPPELRVDEHNPQSLARAMIGLMRDERLRARLAAGAFSMRPKISLAAMSGRLCDRLWELAGSAGSDGKDAARG